MGSGCLGLVLVVGSVNLLRDFQWRPSMYREIPVILAFCQAGSRMLTCVM